ncbi:MAG: hypothetical protein JXB45_06950 [Candidatus Krumholzibacteriota bacterium]|nr:hypothetical protein [Candidatus Krumholzibacteriota bacterium]
MQWMFASLGFVGLVFSLLLLFYDKKHLTRLELPSSMVKKEEVQPTG